MRGVTAVADEIVVESTWGPRKDADIARAATEAIRSSGVLPVGAVKAEVQTTGSC